MIIIIKEDGVRLNSLLVYIKKQTERFDGNGNEGQ